MFLYGQFFDLCDFENFEDIEDFLTIFRDPFWVIFEVPCLFIGRYPAFKRSSAEERFGFLDFVISFLKFDL